MEAITGSSLAQPAAFPLSAAGISWNCDPKRMRQSSRNVADGHDRMNRTACLRIWHASGLIVLATVTLAAAQATAPTAQSPNAAPQQEAPGNLPEVTTHEELETFQVKVNLVEVRVVVRDAQGNAVGNLKQEDFLLFDDKKPQIISRFAMEQRETS